MDLIPLAYIDPGSGTILLQVLIASLIGGVSLFWHRIKKLLGFGPKDGGAQGDESKKPRNEP